MQPLIKLYAPIFFLSLSMLFVACQSEDNASNTTAEKVADKLPPIEESIKIAKDSITQPASLSIRQKLTLTTSALQLVDSITGSSREISFGMTFDSLVKIVSSVLDDDPVSVGINTECGAGPLRMATWTNGLTLVFKETQRGSANWLFAGWLANKPTGKAYKLQTMSGVGVGSTLEELKSAYVATVTKTTLGQEFSVKSGFYGLLSGTGKGATIDVMWSGLSCNFR